MRPENFRSYGSRPVLPETYTSLSGHFLIHYDSPGNEDAPIQESLDNDDIPDYVQEVGLIADLTRQTLVETMGFREEIPDEDGKYDIYIVDLGSGINVAYGWNYLDENDGIEGTSWVEIDNDYSESGYYTNGLEAMRVTVAHEFFHAIQRAYHEKSSGTYIEGGVMPISYSYFYEFSSMWLEDVVVPEGNDYLHFLSSSADSRRFFSNPEQKFSDTDGYSVALFGHYLSNVIENIEDETSSTIIRRVWEKFSDDLLDPIDALDEILFEYNSSFIESWVDFCSRNFHNGKFPDMDNDIYYYSDQTSTVLDELGVVNSNLHQGYNQLSEDLDTLSLLTEENFLDFDLDSHSIEMHSIIADSLGLLTMNYSEMPLFGKYIVTENEFPYIDNVSSDPIPLAPDNIIHFIYAGDNPDVIEVFGSTSYFPSTPELLSVSIVEDGIQVVWVASEGEGVLTYNLYRNEELIAMGISDTTYIDSDIESVTNYEYAIKCVNSLGESELSNSMSITSWPDNNDVVNTKIISMYPNPVSRPGISTFNIIMDYGNDINSVEVSIYDVEGRRVISKQIGSREQGRREEYLGRLLKGLANGVYFISIDCDSFILKEKFTILK